MSESATVTPAEVIELVEQRLGARLTRSMISKELAGGGTPNARVRLTAGLPRPLEDGAGRGELVWSREQIEAWLAAHPRLQRARARDELAAAWVSEGPRAPAVRKARDSGMSWAEVADVISEVEGEPITRQAVCKRFGRLI